MNRATRDPERHERLHDDELVGAVADLASEMDDDHRRR